MNTILSKEEQMALSKLHRLSKELEAAHLNEQELELRVRRQEVRLDHMLAHLTDGEHVVQDADGNQHVILIASGRLEDIELLQPTPCDNHTQRGTPKPCRVPCPTCVEKALKGTVVSIALFLSLAANAQTPTPPTGEAPAEPVWVHSAQQLEDVPGAHTRPKRLPHNSNAMSTEHHELTLPSRIRARAIRERHPHK